MANQRLAQTLPIYKQTYELLLLIDEWRNRRTSRRQYLEEFIVEFGTVKMLIGVCKELEQITNSTAAQMAVLTESIGRQATAWKKTAQ